MVGGMTNKLTGILPDEKRERVVNCLLMNFKSHQIMLYEILIG